MRKQSSLGVLPLDDLRTAPAMAEKGVNLVDGSNAARLRPAWRRPRR